jgi:hypothetical protein
MEEEKVRVLLRRIFVENFTAILITETLISFDEDRPAAEVRAFMKTKGFDCIGVRKMGEVRGYAFVSELESGSLGDHIRPFTAEDNVHQTAPLTDVIRKVVDRGRCFITILGDVGGIATPHDLQKAAVRMWLFGQISILEMALVRAIEVIYPDGSWKDNLSPARLAKARELQRERRRMNQSASLVDCLQLPDKGQILIKNPVARDKLGVISASRAKKTFREITNLRNNLAHSQDIPFGDWSAILERFDRLEDFLQRISALVSDNAES